MSWHKTCFYERGKSVGSRHSLFNEEFDEAIRISRMEYVSLFNGIRIAAVQSTDQTTIQFIVVSVETLEMCGTSFARHVRRKFLLGM